MWMSLYHMDVGTDAYVSNVHAASMLKVNAIKTSDCSCVWSTGPRGEGRGQIKFILNNLLSFINSKYK
jgi:hypothetical protein